MTRIDSIRQDLQNALKRRRALRVGCDFSVPFFQMSEQQELVARGMRRMFAEASRQAESALALLRPWPNGGA